MEEGFRQPQELEVQKVGNTYMVFVENKYRKLLFEVKQSAVNNCDVLRTFYFDEEDSEY
jgi:hypothetical protein